MRDPVHYFEGALPDPKWEEENVRAGYNTPGWYFYEESWAYVQGPFDSEELARAELEAYGKWLDAVPNSWGWASILLDRGNTLRRASWFSEQSVRQTSEGTLGMWDPKLKRPQIWTPSEADKQASDWEVVHNDKKSQTKGFLLRMPGSLHAWLEQRAQDEGVSINQLICFLLAEDKGRQVGSKTSA